MVARRAVDRLCAYPAWGSSGHSASVPLLGGREEHLFEISWTAHWFSSQAAYEHLLCWAPDSRGLIVSHQLEEGAELSLHLYDLEAGRLTLADASCPPYCDTDPVSLPTGTRLAFSRRQNNIFARYILSLDESMEPIGEPPPITPLGAFIAPAWTRSETELIFTGPVQRPGLWMIDAEGESEPCLFLSNPASAFPSWRRLAPGGAIAVASVTAEMNIW